MKLRDIISIFYKNKKYLEKDCVENTILIKPEFTVLDASLYHHLYESNLYDKYLFEDVYGTDFSVLTGELGYEKEWYNIGSEYYLIGKNTKSSQFYFLRPIIKYEKIADIIGNTQVVYDENNVGLFKYGYFPQNMPDFKIQQELDRKLKEDTLNKINNKVYTTNKTCKETSYIGDGQKYYKFTPEENFVYEYDGELYIRATNKKFDTFPFADKKKLKDGTELFPYRHYWIKVEPLEWYLFPNENIAMTKDVIMGGLNVYDRDIFDNKVSYKDSNFNKYLNEYFSKQIYQFGINDYLNNVDFGDNNKKEVSNIIQIQEHNKKEEVTKYRDIANASIVYVFNENDRIDEKSKIIDVQFQRPNHFNVESEMFESYQDAEIIVKVQDENKKISDVQLASCILPEYLPDSEENNDENFYGLCDEKYLNRIKIYKKLSYSQSEDLLNILINKKDELAFNDCPALMFFKVFFRESRIFENSTNLKNKKCTHLFNQFLNNSLYGNTSDIYKNLYEEELSRMNSPYYRESTKKNIVSIDKYKNDSKYSEKDNELSKMLDDNPSNEKVVNFDKNRKNGHRK